MIITKAPFRISFAGGGSDMGAFYKKAGYGAVVSTTIDKYMFIIIHPYFRNKIRIKYSKLEDVNSIEEVKHPIVRECLTLVELKRGVEIASIADVPAGTGIGSSSTFTVALIQALYAYKGRHVSREELAKKACRIEIDIIKDPIGKQDQYAASYGGLNYIQFNADESVTVDPLFCSPVIINKLQKNLLMFYVGNERKASTILRVQKSNMERDRQYSIVKSMVKQAEDMREILVCGKIKRFGEILHEGWLLKKELAENISNPVLDEYYEKALKAGAMGGKLLGAGGGGFFLFYCEPKYQKRLREVLNLRELHFKFERSGSKLLCYDI